MLFGIVLCCEAALLPSLLLYLNNAKEIPFAEMLPYFGIMLALGLLTWAVLHLITKRKALAAVLGALYLLALLNVGRLVPMIHAWNPQIGIKIIGSVLLVILAAATFGLARLKEGFLSDAGRVIAIALAAMILASAVTGQLPQNENSGSEKAAADRIDVSPAEGTSRPNVWWIVADEYAGSELLAKYYHFDNGPFYDWLRGKGFTVSENSYNWNTDTFALLRDMLNLGYTGNGGRSREAVVADSDQRLWNLFRDLGYDLCEAESTNKFRLRNRLKESAPVSITRTAEGNTAANLLLQYSILYCWEEDIISRVAPALSKNNERAAILSVFDWGEDPAHVRTDEPTFTILYVNCPHAPYFFDREGNPVPAEHAADYVNKQYYLDQMIYVTGRIRAICENIISQDPDAIIVLQSDHGMRFAPNMKIVDQTNVLNAVYFHGEPLQAIEGANGLNTWITVLNEQFHLGLPAVEERRTPDVYREETRDPSQEDPNLAEDNETAEAPASAE